MLDIWNITPGSSYELGNVAVVDADAYSPIEKCSQARVDFSRGDTSCLVVENTTVGKVPSSEFIFI